MKSNKLGVLLVNDMVLFPNAEIRFEIDNLEQRQIISVAEATEEKEILVVNPIENNLDSLDITMLPTIGVVASLKLKMDIPNGKTKIVLKGLRRVKVDSYYLNNSYYEATTKKL
ncbi:MAG: LON peptidase substrate-binding domain-containing protein, partial [Romboutsia sp.]|nr:LON peptidase substrate-binding domain-containing protein [Romboutsia sp.]